MAWDETATVQAIMRSEILDSVTCDVCAGTLDGIVLAADDPAWGGEMGMLAHPNCRMVLIPLFAGIAPVMESTPIEQIREAVRHFGTIAPQDWVDRQLIPTTGRNAFAALPLTLEDMKWLEENEDLIMLLFGWED